MKKIGFDGLKKIISRYLPLLIMIYYGKIYDEQAALLNLYILHTTVLCNKMYILIYYHYIST